MAVDGRQAALDNALKQIEKDFGKGAIMRLGEAADRWRNGRCSRRLTSSFDE